MAERIRVMIVEDSLTVRQHIVDVVTAMPDLELVAQAGDGKTAIELCERHRPNVVLMDMMLPVMTGLAATEYIMAYFPTPILIVSASTNRGEAFKTYDALAAGAVDVLEKPLGTETDDGWERRLIASIRMVSRIRVITHPRARLARRLEVRASRDGSPSREVAKVVALGASTGGPGAMLAILKALPHDYPAPILAVVHISAAFSPTLADWLDSEVPLVVRHAVHEERLADVGAGEVLLAPADRHLELAGGRLVLTEGPERHSCRPSVDVLFESVAREMGSRSAACLLTGMGRDGAAGLKTIRDAGGRTIAQDETTSVIFGMPGEAVRIGAASDTLPLDDIAPALLRTVGWKTTGRRR